MWLSGTQNGGGPMHLLHLIFLVMDGLGGASKVACVLMVEGINV